MFSRITYIFLGCFFVYYLAIVLKFTNGQIKQNTPIELAVAPLILYFSSLVGSLILNKLYENIGRKASYIFGAICLVIAGIEMMLINEEIRWMIYIVAVSTYFSENLLLINFHI